MSVQFAPVVLAFGANLGDRAATIANAQAEIAQHAKVSEFAASPLFTSVKLGLSGPDSSAPQYLNGVAKCVTTLKPLELLEFLQELELSYGRVRGEKWGDRTLDIDIVQYAGLVRRTAELTVPHPHAHERDFVLAPWLALDENAVLLRHGRVADLLARIDNKTVLYAKQEQNV